MSPVSLRAAAGLLLALSFPSATIAQAVRAQRTEQLINWYYAAAFGTGVYRSGDRDVAVLQLPFAYEVRSQAQDGWGLALKLPVTFGFYDFRFDDVLQDGPADSVSTMSVLPGVEADFLALRNWRLRPFAYAGYGWELDGEDAATLYSVGVKSRLTFAAGAGEFTLGNTLNYAGYVRDGSAFPLTLFITGLNLAFPSNGTLAGRPVDFGMHLIHYAYLQRLSYPVLEDVNNVVREEFEIAFSLRARSPLPILGFRAEMVGLAFRVGPDVEGIRLFFTLPY
ncbi:MAG TPA: hypothetical protein VIA64_02220 [Burkholderiales bacterium]|jgi:hypothetical protein